MRTKILLQTLAFVFATLFASFAQRNPYEEIGKKAEVLTLSKGEYEEFFDDEDIQQIGTSLINIRTGKIVKLLTKEESEKRLESTMGERFLSVDPLAKSFPWNSPYAYAENDVIRSIDVDGLEKLIVITSKDKFGRATSMAITGVRDKELKKAVDVNLKFANRQDVTTRDVLIITKQEGKKDILSYDNLNNSYREQITKAPAEVDYIEDNSITVPEGAAGAIGIDAFYNSQKLKGAASYDDSKYESFYFEQRIKVSEPLSDKGTIPIDFASKTGSAKYTSDEQAISINAAFVQSELNNKSTEFSKARPGVRNKLIEVTLRGGEASRKYLNGIKAALDGKNNTSIKVVIDKNFKSVSTQIEPEKDYNIEYKISGIK